MHSVALKALGTAALLSLFFLPHTFAQETLSNSTVPGSCTAICAPIVELTDICDVSMDDMVMAMNMVQAMEVSAEQQKAQSDCICNNKSFNVSKIMGLCASCMEMNAGSGNKTAVKSVDRIMTQCSFPTSTYGPEQIAVLAGVIVQATKPTAIMVAANGTMQLGGSGRLEVAVGVWSVGMVMASMGLAVGMFFGML